MLRRCPYRIHELTSAARKGKEIHMQVSNSVHSHYFDRSVSHGVTIVVLFLNVNLHPMSKIYYYYNTIRPQVKPNSYSANIDCDFFYKPYKKIRMQCLTIDNLKF